MDQVLADCIAANTPLSPATQGRIVCTTSGATTCPVVTPQSQHFEARGRLLSPLASGLAKVRSAFASVAELASHGINVDFHLSGAMTNRKMASTATSSNPYTLTVSDMLSLISKAAWRSCLGRTFLPRARP